MENELAPDAVSENFRNFPVSGDRLNEKQRNAIELLALGKSLEAVAEAVGITARTLYNWRQEDAFCAELDRRRSELWSGAASRLRALVHPALDILEEQLRDPYDRCRFRAANAVLRLSDLRQVETPRESK